MLMDIFGRRGASPFVCKAHILNGDVLQQRVRMVLARLFGRYGPGAVVIPQWGPESPYSGFGCVGVCPSVVVFL